MTDLTGDDKNAPVGRAVPDSIRFLCGPWRQVPLSILMAGFGVWLLRAATGQSNVSAPIWGISVVIVGLGLAFQWRGWCVIDAKKRTLSRIYGLIPIWRHSMPFDSIGIVRLKRGSWLRRNPSPQVFLKWVYIEIETDTGKKVFVREGDRGTDMEGLAQRIAAMVGKPVSDESTQSTPPSISVR